MRRVLSLGAVGTATVSLACMVTPTPADPGQHYHCGTLVGGGFSSVYFACEQTRGVYRGDVILGIILTALLLVAAMVRGSRARQALLVLLVLGAAFMVVYTGLIVFGDHLTQRWIAVFSGALATIPAAAVWRTVAAERPVART